MKKIYLAVLCSFAAASHIPTAAAEKPSTENKKQTPATTNKKKIAGIVAVVAVVVCVGGYFVYKKIVNNPSQVPVTGNGV